MTDRRALQRIVINIARFSDRLEVFHKTAEMSQCVAIGEDGNICNAYSSSPGRITYSKSGSDGESRWDLRMARHAELLKNGNLLEIFGDEISGVPIETVLAIR